MTVNEHFSPYLSNDTFNLQKITSKVLKIEQQMPKLFSKPANERFRSYLGNGTSD